MKIYRVKRVRIGNGYTDEEFAFFTNKKKAINYIKSIGEIKSLRDRRDYTDFKTKRYYYNEYPNITEKEYIKMFNSGKYYYEMRTDSFYIETITTEN